MAFGSVAEEEKPKVGVEGKEANEPGKGEAKEVLPITTPDALQQQATAAKEDIQAAGADALAYSSGAVDHAKSRGASPEDVAALSATGAEVKAEETSALAGVDSATSFDFDAEGNLKISGKKDAAPAYDFDEEGNLKRPKAEAAPAPAYDFDEEGNLKIRKQDAAPVPAFDFDGEGNLKVPKMDAVSGTQAVNEGAEWDAAIAAANAREAQSPSPERAIADAPVAAAEAPAGMRVTKEMREAVKAMRQGVSAARTELAAAEALLDAAGGDKAKQAEAAAKVDAAKEKYDAARGEYVAENATRMMKERMSMEDARAKEVMEAKPDLSQKLYDAWKSLGDMNLASKMPNNKIGQAVGRFLSVRTGISTALLGVSVVAGTGAAVGMGALAVRRMLSGTGAAVGSYDMMRAARDASNEGFAADKVVEMGTDEVLKRMEGMEARARLDGKGLEKNTQYAALRREFRDRLKDSSGEAGEFRKMDGSVMPLEDIMSAADASIDAATVKRGRQDTGMKVAAAGVGVLAGSGILGRALGKVFHAAGDTDAGQWVSEKASHAVSGAKELVGIGSAHADTLPSAPGEISDHAPSGAAQHVDAAHMPAAAENLKSGSDLTSHMTAETHAPVAEAAHEVAIDPKGIDVIHRGDGYVKVFARQMEADPAKFGYDAAKHGADVHKWAMHEANGVAKAQGLMDKQLGFDAKHPMKITLNPDKTFTASGNVEMTQHMSAEDVDAKVKEIVADSKKTIFGTASADSDAVLPNPYIDHPTVAGGIAAEAKAVIAQGLGADKLQALHDVADTHVTSAKEVLDSAAPETSHLEIANPSVDAAAEHHPVGIDHGKFEAPGVRANFIYDAKGNVVSLGYNAETSGIPSAMARVAEYQPGPGSVGELDESIGRDMAWMDANKLSIEMKVYTEMAKAGQQSTPEAKFLLKLIKNQALETYKNAGPKFLDLHVFRDIDSWEKAARRGQ